MLLWCRYGLACSSCTRVGRLSCEACAERMLPFPYRASTHLTLPFVSIPHLTLPCEQHPGGPAILRSMRGKDASAMFASIHSSSAREMSKSLVIGRAPPSGARVFSF